MMRGNDEELSAQSTHGTASHSLRVTNVTLFHLFISSYLIRVSYLTYLRLRASYELIVFLHRYDSLRFLLIHLRLT
jgi:hypothetical protein